jgi:hypothetical protein
MPFKKSAKIELENLGYDSDGIFFTEVGFTKDFPRRKNNTEIGYFGVKYNKEWPAGGKNDFILFDFKGTGAVIGQVMTVEPVQPDLKQWWEGDMRIYLNGEQEPRFHGTGHEDEYQGGWSSFWLNNPYSLPLFGMPKSTNLTNISGQINGSATTYRF